MKLEIGDKVERWMHGQIQCILTVKSVNEGIAYCEADNGFSAELYREHDGGALRNTYVMGFASYNVAKK